MADLETERSKWSENAQTNVKNTLNKRIEDAKQRKKIDECTAKAQMELLDILNRAMLLKLAGKNCR